LAIGAGILHIDIGLGRAGGGCCFEEFCFNRVVFQGIWPPGSDGTDINGRSSVVSHVISATSAFCTQVFVDRILEPSWPLLMTLARCSFQFVHVTFRQLFFCSNYRSNSSNGRAFQRPLFAGSTAATAATFTACASPRATSIWCLSAHTLFIALHVPSHCSC
jgi:hypothetical protein